MSYVWKKSPSVPGDHDYFDNARHLRGWVREIGGGKFRSNIDTERWSAARFIQEVFPTLEEAKRHVETIVELES